MKKLKKILSVLLIAVIMLSFAACGSSTGAQADTFNVGTLKGPTGIGMVHLLDAEEKKIGGAEVNYTVAGAPDEIVAKLLSGELDAVCVPVNMGAVLYNKSGGKFQVASINTFGILYITENIGKSDTAQTRAISDIKQLKGKTIYASGKGATPEYVLNYLLEKNGLKAGKDVKVVYLNEHSEVAGKVVSEEGAIAMLPEPFVTTVEMKSGGAVKRVLDLTEIWDNSVKDTPLAMTVFVVNKEYAQSYPGTVNKFLDAYKDSVDKVNSNVDSAAELSVKHGLLASKEIAKKAIPNCNIVFEKASDYKSGLNNLYKIFYEFNPKSIGGEIPNDDLYYEGY